MSAIKKLTGVGGDIRQIAALLQSKGRGGDTMLAHITPREAALLRSQGGSGTINPDTGLPEFFFAGELDYNFNPGSTTDTEAVQAEPAVPAVQEQVGPFPPGPPDEQFGPAELGGAGQGLQAPQQAEPAAAAAPRQTSLSDVLKLGQAFKAARPYLPAAAGVAAAGMGAQQTRQAQQQAQQYRTELERVASPYRSQGQAMIGAAQRGELTPVNRQQLEATRAQLAQQVQGRGGVGAMQATEQIARLQQTLLQNQYDYGLKLANLGDQIAIGAIKTGMQADRDMRALMQNYYTSAARLVGGSPQILGSAGGQSAATPEA